MLGMARPGTGEEERGQASKYHPRCVDRGEMKKTPFLRHVQAPSEVIRIHAQGSHVSTRWLGALMVRAGPSFLTKTHISQTKLKSDTISGVCTQREL